MTIETPTCRVCGASLRPARPGVWVDADGHATGTVAGRNHNHHPAGDQPTRPEPMDMR